jgi:hypothetical protein
MAPARKCTTADTAGASCATGAANAYPGEVRALQIVERIRVAWLALAYGKINYTVETKIILPPVNVTILSEKNGGRVNVNDLGMIQETVEAAVYNVLRQTDADVLEAI